MTGEKRAENGAKNQGQVKQKTIEEETRETLEKIERLERGKKRLEIHLKKLYGINDN